MQKQIRFLAAGPSLQQLRWTLAALVAAASLFLASPARSEVPRVADREFDQAVQQYNAGRKSEAFGRFIALANRGDVDAARIALFMHAYGPMLYGKHWEAGRDDVDYWQKLVRNSSAASARAQPAFVPMVVAPARGKGKQARTPAPTKVSTAVAVKD